jgi:hypothetical protein
MARMSVRIINPGDNVCQYMFVHVSISSWLHNQFEHGKEKNWYEQRETGRSPVAPCDAQDRASCICVSECFSGHRMPGGEV